jgi:dihydroorotate dehydrogenase electron transfer subunit
MTRVPPAHRGTIFLEDAEVLAHEHFEGNQHVLKLRAPQCARAAGAGSFVHITCDESRPMRRPLSIMRASPEAGTIELLYKVVGAGLDLLSGKRAGDRLSTLGPIGKGFVAHADHPRPLLIGGGVGIPPMVFLAETLRDDEAAAFKPLVLMGSEVPFPFRTRPSTILVPGMPEGTIACMPLLDEWGIASRLASLAGYPGCFDGYVTDLAAAWLSSLDEHARSEVEMFACGPTPMLKAAARVANRFRIPCQVSLEEFMACGVGGCAGCAVQVSTPAGKAMKRVCVDGPVFDAAAVFAEP